MSYITLNIELNPTEIHTNSFHLRIMRGKSNPYLFIIKVECYNTNFVFICFKNNEEYEVRSFTFLNGEATPTSIKHVKDVCAHVEKFINEFLSKGLIECTH